jgi:hypothetical protein
MLEFFLFAIFFLMKINWFLRISYTIHVKFLHFKETLNCSPFTALLVCLHYMYVYFSHSKYINIIK